MVVMGRVAAPFAISGWIKVRPFTELPGGLLDYPVWWLGRPGEPDAVASITTWAPWEVERGAQHGQGLVAKLRGCGTREQAVELKGLDIAVPRSELPAHAEGEYYWADLVGLRVANLEGQLLGRVERLLETGANDVLVVQGDRQRLIPFVNTVLVSVDLARGEMVVDWGADF